MANGPLVGPLVGPLIGPLVGSANGLVDRRAVQQAQRQRLAGARSPARARASRLCRAWAIFGWSAGSRQDLPGHPRVNPAGPLAGSPSGDPPGDPAGVSPGSLPGSSPGDLAGVSPGSLSGYSPGDPAEVSPGLLQAHPRGSSGQSIARAHQRILGDPQIFRGFRGRKLQIRLQSDPQIRLQLAADPSAVGLEVEPPDGLPVEPPDGLPDPVVVRQRLARQGNLTTEPVPMERKVARSVTRIRPMSRRLKRQRSASFCAARSLCSSAGAGDDGRAEDSRRRRD